MAVGVLGGHLFSIPFFFVSSAYIALPYMDRFLPSVKSKFIIILLNLNFFCYFSPKLLFFYYANCT